MRLIELCINPYNTIPCRYQSNSLCVWWVPLNLHSCRGMRHSYQTCSVIVSLISTCSWVIVFLCYILFFTVSLQKYFNHVKCTSVCPNGPLVSFLFLQGGLDIVVPPCAEIPSLISKLLKRIFYCLRKKHFEYV